MSARQATTGNPLNRLNQEERADVGLHRLSHEVGSACSKWLAARGLAGPSFMPEYRGPERNEIGGPMEAQKTGIQTGDEPPPPGWGKILGPFCRPTAPSPSSPCPANQGQTPTSHP